MRPFDLGDRAIDVLQRRDSKAAERVTINDDAIDELEQVISNDVLRVLALRQPMAVDLRVILSSIKIAAALERMGRVIACGVDYVLHGFRPAIDDTDGQIAVGLLSISEGMIYRATGDDGVLAASFPMYDALYADLSVKHALQAGGLKPPAPTRPGPGDKIDFLRALYKRRD